MVGTPPPNHCAACDCPAFQPVPDPTPAPATEAATAADISALRRLVRKDLAVWDISDAEQAMALCARLLALVDQDSEIIGGLVAKASAVRTDRDAERARADAAEAKASLMPCGHPAACLLTGPATGETACGWCAAIAECDRNGDARREAEARAEAAERRAADLERSLRAFMKEWTTADELAEARRLLAPPAGRGEVRGG